MDRYSLDLETALRVLGAITEHREPDPADVYRIRLFAGLDRDLSADELACEVLEGVVGQPSRRTRPS